MEITIPIDGKNIRFKSSGSSPLRYKAQFKRDFFADLMKLEKVGTDISTLDLEIFYNIAWIYARVADPTIPTQWEWLDTFDIFPIMEIVPHLQDLINKSMGTINLKN